MQNFRLFIAIKLELSGRNLLKVKTLHKSLQSEDFRWESAEKAHVTLKFLGDTDISLIPEIEKKLSDIAEKNEAFPLIIGKLGVFHKGKRPNVLFAEIKSQPNLQKLAEIIDGEMNTMGFEKENRTFSPHLTLARIKFIKQLTQFENTILNEKYFLHQTQEIKDFHLYRSITKPEGAIYETLKTFNLQK